MPVYLIADIKVTDDKWVPGYAASVHELVHKHGGKYLARSGNVTDARRQAARNHHDRAHGISVGGGREGLRPRSPYAPFAAARQRGSESRLQLIDDTDLAGTIAYLPKG